MAATWTITNTEYDIKGSKGDNQITTLHWECTDEDGEHRGRVYGSIAIPEPSGDFIAYNDVTHEDCVTWCKAILGSEQVTANQNSVQNQINSLKNPTQGSGKPW